MLDLASFLLQEVPERIFMSGNQDENDIVMLEYSDGSRFFLILNNLAGSGLMEKEMIEIFSAGGALSIRDFVEMRVRSIAGEKDQLFLPERCKFNEQIKRWGYPFWEVLRSRLVEPDAAISKGIVPVELAMEDQPFAEELAKIAEAEKSAPWQQRNIFSDKGWYDAFRHFAQACLENSVPETASGADGKFASDLGFALLESKKQGIPLKFTREK